MDENALEKLSDLETRHDYYIDVLSIFNHQYDLIVSTSKNLDTITLIKCKTEKGI